MQPIDVLVRKVIINGAPVMDSRLVVTPDGLAVLIARPDGVPTVISRMIAPTMGRDRGGVVTATDGLNTWLAQVDTRCGTCAGRYELSRIIPGPLIAAAFAEPAAELEPASPTPAYSDTY